MTDFPTITSDDFSNAVFYARNRLLKEKTDALTQKNPNVVWQNSFSDGSTVYRCPSGVTGCVQGWPRIASQTECLSQSYYSSKDPSKGTNPANWYLEWATDPTTNVSNCYLGNWGYRHFCDTTPQKGNFYWDDSTNSCYITKNFCDANGFLDYAPGTKNPPGSGNGGSCQMSPGQDVASIFGMTFARGVIGKSCWN